MPNGFGYGFRGGRGFGFRGASPSWPYVGLGRGGLPRCWYPGLYTAPYWPAMQAPSPFYGAPVTAPETAPFTPQMTPEQELDFLKNQAQTIKSQLEQIESRMHELGTGE